MSSKKTETEENKDQCILDNMQLIVNSSQFDKWLSVIWKDVSGVVSQQTYVLICWLLPVWASVIVWERYVIQDEKKHLLFAPAFSQYLMGQRMHRNSLPSIHLAFWCSMVIFIGLMLAELFWTDLLFSVKSYIHMTYKAIWSEAPLFYVNV